jgi:hypothetical protein
MAETTSREESAAGWDIPTMLIVLNRRALPNEIRLKGWRLPIIAVTALMFISLSLFLLYQIITNPTSLA